MPEFYDSILYVLIRGMAAGVFSVYLLIAVLETIRARDIKKYPFGDRGSRIAMVLSVCFYVLAFIVYGTGNWVPVIKAEACPIAQRVLTDEVVISKLEISHQRAIVGICGKAFFERYSGIKWKGEMT